MTFFLSFATPEEGGKKQRERSSQEGVQALNQKIIIIPLLLFKWYNT